MFNFQPEQMADSILQLSRMAQGWGTLSSLDEIKVGVSPKEPVYKEDELVLYHYTPQAEKLLPVPVLINYALVNRPYMADLQDGRSIIQGLLKAGLDLYLIDWGYPSAADRCLTLDDYVNGYIARCVDVICERHEMQGVNMMGICQGGTLSCCYAALHPERVRNLITTVSPIDFHTDDCLLTHLARHVDVDLIVDTLGNIPGEILNASFLGLKPYHLLGQKYVQALDFIDDKEKVEDFLRMEKWIFDSPDQAGEAYRQFIKDLYQQNKLIKGTFQLGEKTVNLRDITMPVMNIYAQQDHLVPPSSSRALAAHVGTEDYNEWEFPGGHIGLFVSGKAQRAIPRAIVDWLQARIN